MLSLLVQDARPHLDSWGGGSGPRWLRLIFLTPGFQLVICVRLQIMLGKVPVVGRLMRRIAWYFTTIYFGCDIDPAARFGPGLYVPHPVGIVIGGEWSFGSRLTLLQNVTFGRQQPPTARSTVGDDVFIGAGAVIVGQLQIGSRVRIGANSVVTHSVPDDTTAVGIPARILEKD